ncbi:MAG: PAS domain S-box protein [Bacteroidota bacterium]
MKKIPNHNLRFLEDGGEMGRLTREKDWSQTSIGAPEFWPQSLRTSLSIVLNSRFPMFLFWGKNQVCFYNDAYRPSLGIDGKHPSILGMNGKEAWGEIWEVIKPMIDNVLETGEATWNEDLYLPIYRNGKMEDVYWTFSYSQVKDSKGKPKGVFVTCTETTENVKTIQKLKETTQTFQAMADNIPNLAWMAHPDGSIYWYNKKWYEYTATTFEEMEGWGWQKLHKPEILPCVMAKWQSCISSGEPFEMTFPLKGADGNFRHFLTRVLPVKNDDGIIKQWFGTNTDIAVQKEIEDALNESKNQLEFAIEATELGTFDYNPTENTFTSNTRLKEWFGLPITEEIELPDAIQVMAPEDRDRVVQAIEKALDYNSGGSYDIEYTIVNPKTAKETRVHAKGRAWFNEDKIAYRFNGTLQDISEKHLVYKKLQASERRFREAVEQAPAAIAIYRGTDFVVEVANKLAQELSGKTREELINKPIFETIPEAAEQGFKAILEQVYHTGKPFHGSEVPISLTKNNETKELFVNMMYEPLYCSEKKINGVINIVIDVTEQVLAKKKIEENQAKLNLIIEGSDLGIWELNLKTSEVSYSDKYIALFGYKEHEDLKHEDLKKFIHPDDLKVREKAFQTALETGILHYETRLIWADKSIHWVEGKGRVIFDEDKTPLKMMGIIRDITLEKNHQLEIEESEQKFRLLADSMPQHIWTADVEGNLNYFNQSVYDYSGLTPKQVEELGWLEIVHPDDREENIKVWTKAISSGKDFLLEHRFRKHTGEYRWQLSRAIPQKDENGNIQMWVGTSTDIQDQRTFTNELEKQVVQRTQELVQKNIDLGKMNSELQSFAYVSSHDLQEPLRKIQVFTSRIAERDFDNLSETTKEYFNKIVLAASRMQTLIQDLLTYSRANTSDRKFENKNLDEIIEEVRGEVSEELAEKNAVINSQNIGSAKVIVFQFRQLLHNLIGNSLKFSKPNQLTEINIKSEIISGANLNDLRFDANTNYFHLTFSDNGIGFDAEYSEKIFEMFQRLHNTEYKGTGIGLSIVKKIVENHNGIISAKSSKNMGATFDIYLPISK